MTTKAPSQYTIQFATTALLQSLLVTLKRKRILTDDDFDLLFKGAIDSQAKSKDGKAITAFLTEMKGTLRSL